MGLRQYHRKRDFDRTPEPRGGKSAAAGRAFVVQKHAASRLHYDFRLELGGTLKSWAVPKGPSLDPAERRLAVHVEDHPIEYGKFEGVIPKGAYGGGTVLLWDRGRWIPVGDPEEGYRRGKLKFTVKAEKLQGGFTLVRMGGKAGENGKNWLLIKERDAEARSASRADILKERPESVASGRSLEEIAAGLEPARRSRQLGGRTRASGREGSAARQAGRRPTPAAPSAPPAGAVKARLPDQVELQLATAVTEAPSGSEWLHEIKFDGYRSICRIVKGKATFLTRAGKDWTHRFRDLAQAAAALPARQAVLDGEVVKLQSDGISSFQALQNSLEEGKGKDLVYFVFDLLHLDGYDLSGLALQERKAALSRLCEAGGAATRSIRYSDHVVGMGPETSREACRMALEGIISKKKDHPYRPGRGREWLKVKCLKRQEFIIGGFTEPAGTRSGFGALLVGVHDESGKLIYSGRVGTGFTERSLKDLSARLSALEVKKSPFSNPPTGVGRRGVRWVKPVLAAEVEFAEWTSDGLLRIPSFQGLREDRDVREIVRERSLPVEGVVHRKEVPAARRAPGASGVEIAGVRLTHPDRILYPEQGITKQELAEFYEAIADWALPHVTGRPLSLVRCPQGHQSGCFYQKHATGTLPPSIHSVKIQEEKGRAAYLTIDSLAGLIGLVQMGVLEIHTWGALSKNVERPDRMILDLDPAADVSWERMVESARAVRALLASAGLECFLKTTGGKGLHVVVPLTRQNDWQEVKEFSRGLAERMTREAPDRFTAKMSKAKRHGRIFIDYLRNVRGATAVAAYSTRARPGAPISTPVRWEELKPSLRSDSFTLKNLPQRIARTRGDPWEGFEAARARITTAMAGKLGPLR